MGGGLESRCVVRVYGADGAVRNLISVSLIKLPCFIKWHLRLFH